MVEHFEIKIVHKSVRPIKKKISGMIECAIECREIIFPLSISLAWRSYILNGHTLQTQSHIPKNKCNLMLKGLRSATSLLKHMK